MMLKLVEKFGQLPAACQVEPAVSSSRSTSATSGQHAAADDPAADHHHPRMRLHGPPPASHYASRQAPGESADMIRFGLRGPPPGKQGGAD
jgi:hypothetical protein